MKSNKRLGQHFIVDPLYIERIISISEISSDDIVLEIGTGYGTLTKRLCEKAKIVISYEIDERLFDISQKLLKSYNNLILLNDNALKTKYSFNKIVSNLPYYLSKKFVYWLIKKSFTSATVTLQKDFVEKLISTPSSTNYKAISVVSQLAFNINIYDKIPPTAFHPPPKVYSYIVKFEPKSQVKLDDSQIKIINQIFTFRGKKIRSLIKHFYKNKIYKIKLNENKIFNLEKRVEDLHPLECLSLAKFLLEQKIKSF
ncbi:MAG: 16S rRNA (adenine(1518)-N(6)/adenine(1519)-N(6))-dimethyltransferase RsmA [Nitrososphaeria archaeon]